MNEEQIEEMIEGLLEQLEEDCSQFTAWEQTFLESIEESNNFQHLTPRQIEKLEEIWGKNR